MVFVLLFLVVVLAMASGALYMMLKVAKAERREEVAELRNANLNIANKCRVLNEENDNLKARLERLESIKGGIN